MPLNAQAMFARALTLVAVTALAACGAPEDGASKDDAPAAPSRPAATAAPALSPAAEAGRKNFRPCAVCHSVREGDNARVGPSVYGVYGRKAGAVDGFAYSKAMKESTVVWTEETLNAFLEDPQGFMPRNRMAYPGDNDPDNRAAIIDYLKTLGPADDEHSVD